jgi:oligopeptide transport system ATP-binding protein
MSENNNNILLAVNNLALYFPIFKGIIFKKKIGEVKAVDGVSFSITSGETLGLVGESGCGKTSTGRAILQLDHPTSGEVIFEGADITKLNKYELRPLRKKIQIIFQDPFGSLDPRMTVRDIIGEPLLIHNLNGSKAEYRDQVAHLMETVGLNPRMVDRYPHEFSGGQRQRIGIARALSVRPSLIICDEPVSALDVSIQAQIINLLEELQEKFHLTYLFIAHDLAVVRHISNRIAVMYLGEIVEFADRNDLYHNPMHPYTQALITAVPIPDPSIEAERKHVLISGEVPSPFNPPSGCKFHTRCPHIHDLCRNKAPRLNPVNDRGHQVACHLSTKTPAPNDP